MRAYRTEVENLNGELENRERALQEANENITLLSLRINFMITQKFMNIVEKINEENFTRSLNDGFDGIIYQANQNLDA
jgi:hypothetical protein